MTKDSLRNTSTTLFTDGSRITAGTSGPATTTGKEIKEERNPSPMMTPSKLHIQSECPQASTTVMETLNVKLPDSEQNLVVSYNKPVKLQVLLNEVQVTINREDCLLEYCREGRRYILQTQEQLDEYLRLPSPRPQLQLGAVVKCNVIK